MMSSYGDLEQRAALRAQLSSTELSLLTWLGLEDFSQYGECYGKDLDALVAKGLAQVHSGTGRRNTFVAKGDGPMFEQVSLTDAGRAILSVAAT